MFQVLHVFTRQNMRCSYFSCSKVPRSSFLVYVSNRLKHFRNRIWSGARLSLIVVSIYGFPNGSTNTCSNKRFNNGPHVQTKPVLWRNETYYVQFCSSSNYTCHKTELLMLQAKNKNRRMLQSSVWCMHWSIEIRYTES